MNRVYDFLLYVLIGVGAVFAVVWYAASASGDSEFVGRWIGLGGTSLILFGYAVQRHRRMIRWPWFWVVLFGAAAVHVSAYVLVLRRVTPWKVMWFVVPMPLENMAIDTAASFVARKHMSTRRVQQTN